MSKPGEGLRKVNHGDLLAGDPEVNSGSQPWKFTGRGAVRADTAAGSRPPLGATRTVSIASATGSSLTSCCHR